MSSAKDVLGPMRPPFLILTPACVMLGVGTAVRAAGSADLFHIFLVLIGATAAHISVNAFNEYFDFKSGLDFRTERTPFSGGSGTLPAKPGLAGATLIVAVVTVAITTAVGIYFTAVRGVWLLPIGLLGVALVYAYTPWMTHNPFLCLIAPGLGFGPLMVMGTHFALTGSYDLIAFIASLIPFFLVSNLLLLNQFPDVEADRSIGRKHYPLVKGRRASSFIYNGFQVMAYLVIGLSVFLHAMPKWSLLGMITLVLAIPAGVGAYKYSENIEKLVPFMGANVLINIATPVFVAIGLMI